MRPGERARDAEGIRRRQVDRPAGGGSPALAEVQEPYLQDYWREYPRTHRIVDGRDETPFPLDDLRMLYEWSRYSRRFGEEAYYASLRTALDTVRHSLVGPIRRWSGLR